MRLRKNEVVVVLLVLRSAVSLVPQYSLSRSRVSLSSTVSVPLSGYDWDDVRKKTGFDWDEHLGEIVGDDLKDQADLDDEQREELAAGNEWIPKDDDEEEYVDTIYNDDEDLDLPRQRWDDVDPEAYNYRNPPAGEGTSWSRIRLRSDWFQFDRKGNLLPEFERFDVKSFTVPDSLFDPELVYEFGHIDVFVLTKLTDALNTLGGTVKLVSASPTFLRFKYLSDAQHRVGIEAYANGIIKRVYPDIDIYFDSLRTVDPVDGASAWIDADKGLPTDLF